jgi:hydrogenase nickel incorporation protein HypB
MKVMLNKPILDLNDRLAAENRRLMAERGVYLLDLLASPGAGKTSLILATIHALKDRYRIAVIEGDIASDVDAVRIKDEGIPAVQINTGGACHLEAAMIARALDTLDLDALDLIIIENVGNLVCPTEFDLGEDDKVMILSVPEGHDKPLKYPGIFQVARAVILNKIDTLPFFDFDERAFRQSVGQLNPHAVLFPLAAAPSTTALSAPSIPSAPNQVTPSGVSAWTQWLSDRIQEKQCN